MIELERTYLIRSLPPRLSDSPCTEMVDVYFPDTVDHPVLRLRRRGDRFELTKKQPVADSASKQSEETIALSAEEFDALAQAPGRRVAKRRYSLNVGSRQAEVDVFVEDLRGLVLVDFEFDSEEAMNSFEPPAFCLADVSELEILAGGLLAGKSYKDIAPALASFGYKPLLSNV